MTTYSDVPGYKERNNLTDPQMIVCWPRVRLGEQEYGLATHLAGLMAATDADHDGIPYASSSNKRLEITSSGYADRNGNWCYDTLRITRQAKNGEDIRADFELPPETDASKELPEDEKD